MGILRIIFLLFLIVLPSHQNIINLIKCCPFNTYIIDGKCVHTDEQRNFSDFTIVYDENDKATNERFQDLFKMTVLGVALGNSYDLLSIEQSTVHLIHDGTLRFTIAVPNSDPHTIPIEKSSFCLDYVKIKNSTDIGPSFWNLPTDTGDKKAYYYNISALLVSCVFLSLVIIVYILLPELRNIFGKMVMACVITIFGAFLSLAILTIYTISDIYLENGFCVSLSFLIIFFAISSSSWMTTLSFQLWRTFRHNLKQRRRSDQRNRIVFIRYCIFSWGIPFLLAALTLGIDAMDLSHLPSFIKPHIADDNGCFMEGTSKLLYLYLPMIIFLICNWILFLITTFNVWITYKQTNILNDNRLKDFICNQLKMSVVMGISWILEVISSFWPDLNKFWYISDTYNMLIGVAYFIIFVCKRKIYVKLFNKRREPITSEVRMQTLTGRSIKMSSQRF